MLLGIQGPPPFTAGANPVVIANDTVNTGNRVERRLVLGCIKSAKACQQTVYYASLKRWWYVTKSHGGRICTPGAKRCIFSRAHGTNFFAFEIIKSQQAETGTSAHIHAQMRRCEDFHIVNLRHPGFQHFNSFKVVQLVHGAGCGHHHWSHNDVHERVDLGGFPKLSPGHFEVALGHSFHGFGNIVQRASEIRPNLAARNTLFDCFLEKFLGNSRRMRRTSQVTGKTNRHWFDVCCDTWRSNTNGCHAKDRCRESVTP